MSAFTLEPDRSKVTIETRAVGMLAKLAHDLSIIAREILVETTLDGRALTVVARLPVARLEVDGVRKAGAVDRALLSASDKVAILEKMRAEVLRGADVAVRATGELPGDALATEGRREMTLEVEIDLGRAKSTVTTRGALEVASDTVTARGRLSLDLPRFGITPPKGPLGAFRVHDTVEVAYDLVFRRG